MQPSDAVTYLLPANPRRPVPSDTTRDQTRPKNPARCDAPATRQPSTTSNSEFQKRFLVKKIACVVKEWGKGMPQLESSEAGKDIESTAVISPQDLPLIMSPALGSDDQLVEVAIQPMSIGQRVDQKRRKTIPRKPKAVFSSVPEDMVVEATTAHVDNSGSKKILSKRN
ncbi:Roadblock/LC7 domain superfamily [Striga asiatica]|uniref:Roadblock/LC7 domain superfamily n=1 Tax=Striga asiatica TaxID=4170 RepID=A0A5A7QUR9_STRAF|nr:Roadblock/LC7 domain superfamily [Striga asiatica]